MDDTTCRELQERHEPTYDARCYTLAEHFLSDHPSLDTFPNARALAVEIQSVIEEWIETELGKQYLLSEEHAAAPYIPLAVREEGQ
jgi:hypothetical protein